MIAFVAFAIVAMRKRHLGKRSYETLVDLQADLERLTGLRGVSPEKLKGVFASAERIVLTGALPTGRRAEVRFFRGGEDSGPRVRLSVETDPSLRVSVYKESFFTPLAKWLGLTTDVDSGDAAFDGAYVVSTRKKQKAELAYARGLKEAISWAFETFGCKTFEFEKGKLTVTVDRRTLEPVSYAPLLATLDVAASAFDRVPLVIRALGGSARKAFRGPHGVARCAYCHGDVTGEEPDLVACEQCHTALHAGCWDELGHCPLLGCTGHNPERARTT